VGIGMTEYAILNKIKEMDAKLDRIGHLNRIDQKLDKIEHDLP
jgi:hypothetical protein